MALLDADNDDLMTQKELRLVPSEMARFLAADIDTNDGWLSVSELAKVSHSASNFNLPIK